VYLILPTAAHSTVPPAQSELALPQSDPFTPPQTDFRAPCINLITRYNNSRKTEICVSFSEPVRITPTLWRSISGRES
jgi:hypothetical protein